MDWRGAVELKVATLRDDAARAHARMRDAARVLWEADPALGQAEWREMEARYAAN